MTTMRLKFSLTTDKEQLYRDLADNLLEASASAESYRMVFNGYLIQVGKAELHAQTASVTSVDGVLVLLWTDLYGQEHTTDLDLVRQVRAYWI